VSHFGVLNKTITPSFFARASEGKTHHDRSRPGEEVQKQWHTNDTSCPPFSYRTQEESEAVLLQLAHALTPGDAGLHKLAHSLASMQETVPDDEESLIGLGLSPAEVQLRKAEARYRALVEQIPAITFLAPLDGSLSELYVSPQIEQMLGFTAKEWLENPILWYQQLHPDDQDRWQAEFARTAGQAWCGGGQPAWSQRRRRAGCPHQEGTRAATQSRVLVGRLRVERRDGRSQEIDGRWSSVGARRASTES
jgi:PAS domain S-box-containing protein